MGICNKSPFPYYGGKQKIAARVWDRLGDPALYIEPFFGSGAVLLNRPAKGRSLINDADGYVCNFWRAIQRDPEGVAARVDPVVCELDLHARNRRLIAERDAFTERLCSDPEYFDLQLAAWWAWGASVWIGPGWASKDSRSKPVAQSGTNLRGILSPDRQPLGGYLACLAGHLQGATVYCGDWSRCVTRAVIRGPLSGNSHPTTAVFLDPPYSPRNMQGASHYAVSGAGDGSLSDAVRAWCFANGHLPYLRLALCGAGDEHAELEAQGWTVESWSRGSTFGGRVGRESERVWYSPHCLTPGTTSGQLSMLGGG